MVICTKRITASFVIDFRLLLLVNVTVDVLNKLVAPVVVLVVTHQSALKLLSGHQVALKTT